MVVLNEIALICLILFGNGAECNKTSVLDDFVSLYGEGYGTEWIYFPDGDGTPHFVSLTDETDEYAGQTRSLFSEVEFRLYTRHKNNTEDSIPMTETAEMLTQANDIRLASLPLKIITHGWRSSVESDAVAGIKNAYLHSQNVNVITVDWSYTANSIFYHWVANQTVGIGIEIAAFLDALSERYNVTGRQVHLIGHSLGAHIMGIAAYHSNITVNRITGLDPARPLFEYPSRDETAKLDSSDADFVDVIHTCGGVLGIEGPVGTADFFPNSGIPPQPGCDTIPRILEACSHGRSYYYFAESITSPKAFPAYQCGNWLDFLENNCHLQGYMGDIVNRNNTGSYFLATNQSPPYGRVKQVL